MKLNNFFSLIFVVFFTISGYTQTKLLGKVKDFNNKPVAFAIVYLDGVQTDVSTNERGYFEVLIPEETKNVMINSPEYGILAAPYSGEPFLSFIYVNKKYKQITETDKVSLGYGDVEKKDLAYNIPKVEYNKNGNVAQFTDIYDMIQGRLKGVRVTSGNRIIVRGSSSIISSSDPLFVVNGMIVQSIDYIRPIDVKDISVLKGAATSIYGSRGANGVILITLTN